MTIDTTFRLHNVERGLDSVFRTFVSCFCMLAMAAFCSSKRRFILSSDSDNLEWKNESARAAMMQELFSAYFVDTNVSFSPLESELTPSSLSVVDDATFCSELKALRAASEPLDSVFKIFSGSELTMLAVLTIGA
jgi:hypothetical protein